MRKFINEMIVLPGNCTLRCTLLDSDLGSEYDLNVIAIVRGNETVTKIGAQHAYSTG